MCCRGASVAPLKEACGTHRRWEAGRSAQQCGDLAAPLSKGGWCAPLAPAQAPRIGRATAPHHVHPRRSHRHARGGSMPRRQPVYKHATSATLSRPYQDHTQAAASPATSAALPSLVVLALLVLVPLVRALEGHEVRLVAALVQRDEQVAAVVSERDVEARVLHLLRGRLEHCGKRAAERWRGAGSGSCDSTSRPSAARCAWRGAHAARSVAGGVCTHPAPQAWRRRASRSCAGARGYQTGRLCLRSRGRRSSCAASRATASR